MQQRVFKCVICFFESMQVQFKEYAGAAQRVCRCSIIFLKVCTMQVQLKEYAGAANDMLRVCRCSREYASAA